MQGTSDFIQENQGLGNMKFPQILPKFISVRYNILSCVRIVLELMLMVMSMIIPVSLIAILTFVIVLVVSAKGQNSEGGEDVVKNVYVYLVLFATLMMVIGGSVSGFMAVADIVAPAPYYQSYEDFKRFQIERKSTAESDQEQVEPSEEELLAQYDAMVAAEKDRQINRAKNNLIKSFGWIIIPLPIFIYFQKNLVKKGV